MLTQETSQEFTHFYKLYHHILSNFLMNSQHLTISLFILIVTGVGEGLSNNQTEFYGTCNRSFSCGDISGLRYPFRRGQDSAYCGYPGFELNCEEESPPTINIMNLTYHVLEIDPTGQILKIVREDMTNLACPQNLVNTTIDYDLFSYTSNYRNISLLYGCPSSFKMPVIGAIFCENNGGIPVFLVPGIQSPESCKSSIVMPFPVGFVEPAESGLVLQKGFEVRWKVEAGPCNACTQSGGDCLYNNDTHLTTCACREAPFLADSCSTTRVSSPSDIPKSSKKASLSIILPTIGAIIVVVGIGMGIFVCRQRKKRRMIKVAAAQSNVSSKGVTSDTQSNFTSSTPSNPSSKVNKEYGKCSYFGAQVFTYEELEVATDNFNDSRELGDGGYGTVYHGKLLDGREVAVKRLYDNNFKRVEQFMNEVEILTRLSHKNLLKLYGCTSKRSRELLLVYEYIPNGTVADHLHGKLANSNSKSCLFTWSVRLKIAIETAEALTYLHESDIIHRDVKTNNILLDESYRVKVADFGLSRLFPTNCTHVSTAPQGTPGYVDPEYYLCYQLTDKSDVYSFGVVLVELISSLHAVDTNRDRLDINLAAMAINKITTHMLDELVDKRIGFETNDSVRRMITLVAELAFRCLQEKTDMRPTMKEVLEVLRGIQNDEMNAQKPEVLDILVDDGALFKDHCTEPSSPDYGVTNTLYGRSMPNSSDG